MRCRITPAPGAPGEAEVPGRFPGGDVQAIFIPLARFVFQKAFVVGGADIRYSEINAVEHEEYHPGHNHDQQAKYCQCPALVPGIVGRPA